MYFVDSNVLIGAKRKRDRWHSLAFPIVEKIARGELGRGYILDYVIVEVFNFLLRKDGVDIAIDALSDILMSRYLELVIVDEIGFHGAINVLNEYRFLSLTDAAIAYYMGEMNISTLFSFDSRFDSVPWVDRKTSV